MYLGFTNPTERVGREANFLMVNAFMPPVAQQKVKLAVIVERLFLAIFYVHNQRPVQPC